MNDTKICPFCSEEIKAAAIKCKHCGERLDAPGTPAPPGTRATPGGTAVPGMVGLGVQAGIGTRLGTYILEEVIGDGGMGTVYSARHERLGHQVAIKILASNLSRDPQLVARFEDEARLQANINHPNIVGVQDLIIEGDTCAFVMEYVRGRTLEDLIRFETGPIPFPRCLQIFVPVLNALGYAHDQGIVHRDIKPSNIMIAEVAGEEVVKVADFGIAKAMGGAQRTATGTKMGTLHYMSPEQCRGSKDIDHRADIYSLGVTLYEMATGRVPFDLESEFELMKAHIEATPLPPSAHYPGVSSSFERVILKAMSKDRDQRFRSAGEFREELVEVQEEEVAAAPSPAGPPAIEPATPVEASPEPDEPTAASESPYPIPAVEYEDTDREADQSESRGRLSPLVVVGVIGALLIIPIVAVVIMSSSGDTNESQSEEPTPAAASQVDSSRYEELLTESQETESSDLELALQNAREAVPLAPQGDTRAAERVGYLTGRIEAAEQRAVEERRAEEVRRTEEEAISAAGAKRAEEARRAEEDARRGEVARRADAVARRTAIRAEGGGPSRRGRPSGGEQASRAAAEARPTLNAWIACCVRALPRLYQRADWGSGGPRPVCAGIADDMATDPGAAFDMPHCGNPHSNR